MLGEGAFGEVWKAILRMSVVRTTTNQGNTREEEVTDVFVLENPKFCLYGRKSMDDVH